jgi:hypothetical protein
MGRALKAQWIPHDTRDAIVDYIKHWTKRTELPAKTLLGWLGLAVGKFHHWKHRYGRPNEHNARTPRDGWLAEWEKQAIVDYHDQHPLEGYRRLAFTMLDHDVVAVSPSSVYRVLKRAGRLDRKWQKPSKKGPVSNNRSPRTSTGTWTFRTSTWAARFTTCAHSWMATAG